MLLAIDTSTGITGLAAYDQAGVLAECVWQSGRNHTVQLLPQLDMLLQHLGHRPADIQAVGVALGPGSWSGLRVGLSVAKGLAVAGNLPVIGITTLDALAYQQQHAGLVVPLVRLGRERFATAEYRSDGAWRRMGEYQNLALAEICAGIAEPVRFCGDVDAGVQAYVQQQLGTYASFPSAVANLRRPGYLAELAWQRWCAGQVDDVAQLEPVYLGTPVRVE